MDTSIKLIIFDWDDVFTLGSKEGYIKCLHDSIADLGVHLDPDDEHERILQSWGKHHNEELKGLLQERPDLLEQAVKLYEDKFFGGVFVSMLSYVNGANNTLKELSKDYTLTIATGAHPDILKNQVMPKFDVPIEVFSQIESVYDIDDPEKHKPHPYMLQKIMKHQGFMPNETIFVGDARSDVQMARSARVEPVVVLTGHLNRQQAQELNVKHIIPDVTHLPGILDRH